MKKIVLLFAVIVYVSTVFGQEGIFVKNGVKSFLNQKAPELVVEKWLGDKPDTEGKFIILEFWGVNCNPCKDCIPHLNKLNRHFKEDVVIIGLTSDKEEKIATMKLPVRERDKIVRWEKATMDYPIAIDTKKSTREAFGLKLFLMR